MQVRHDAGEGGDLCPVGRGRALLRRRRGRRHRQQHRVRPLRLRHDRGHRARLPARRSAAFGQRRDQHRAAQHGDAVRRLQDERHRTRRWRLRPPRVHRDAVRGVAGMTATSTDGRKPMLDGVRVIECSLLGPAAITSHLIDLGAEVIKVESPAGDYGRKMTWPIMEGTSLLHLHVNRGKQSLVLNLKQPDAIAVFEDLVRTSDVVVEAMRPGFLAKMGLGYDRLKELNPKIVMCTISGYGATGPYQNLPSHGIAYDAWSGTIQPVV